ncbi:MAG: tyrosine--tRNA ligase [Patescibacteria group bacterium]
MKINKNSKKIDEVLTRRVQEILPTKEAFKKLMSKKSIRLYLGIDPTGTRLHLGHSIALRKLREFAELGHESILLIGTGTVLAGDPSERDKSRPHITQKEIDNNMATWKKQASKILDFSKIKIKYNGDWLLKLDLAGMLSIASNISAVHLFQRDMFKRRMKANDTIWMHEILYPLLQGYDSVAMDVDLEIGGTDQVFNMLIGRELQQKMNNREKFILTVPMILGTDGKQMSKTSGNCVWLADSPQEMFGKIMSMPDSMIISYFELLTDVPIKKIKQYSKDLNNKKVNPKNLKEELALEIVKFYHSEKEAKKAQKEFKKIFVKDEIPENIKKISVREKEMDLLSLLVDVKMAISKSEAKRLVMQKGVKIDSKIEDDWKKVVKIKKGQIIQVGKRKFVEIK